MPNYDFSALNETDLRELHSAVVSEMKDRKENATRQLKKSLSVRQVVEFCNLTGKHAANNGKRCRILKLNPKKVKLSELDNPNQIWNADYSLIRPVNDESSPEPEEFSFDLESFITS